MAIKILAAVEFLPNNTTREGRLHTSGLGGGTMSNIATNLVADSEVAGQAAKDASETASRRKLFVDDFEKSSKFDFAIAAEFLKGHIEFGKMTISHLFFINGGGLAALVALHPLLRDANQLWLLQQMWSAIGFGLGLAFVTAAAVAQSFNLDQGVELYLGRGHANELSLRNFYLGQGSSLPLKSGVIDNAVRRAMLSLRVLHICIVCSGLFAAGAAVLLALRLMRMAVP